MAWKDMKGVDDRYENVGIIITARVKSSRLENKVLQEIKGRKTIEILLDHLTNDKIPVILAIPENEDDDILKEIAESKGIEVYRGQDSSPLHRLYECANYYGFDNVVRITADDILIDQLLLRNQIQWHLRYGFDYTYMKRCVEGIAGEVIKTSALKRVVDKVGDKPVEFISYYLKTNDFNYKEFYPPFEYQYTFRLTMDYPNDLLLLRILFISLTEPFGTLDIINFFKSHRYLLRVNNLPKVTVYTCNYNTGKYIISCMRSVIEQTYNDFEFIVIDDCSTDDSMNIITEFYSKLSWKDQKRIKILRNDKNIGLPACCNKVLGIARGENIIRIDSDDTLKSNAVQRMSEEIEINGVQGIISGYEKVDSKGKLIETVNENHWHPGGCLLKRWSVNEVKYKLGLEYFEGLDFFKRFNEIYKVKFIEEPLWHYRQHDNQKSSIKNLEERKKAKKEMDVNLTHGSTTSA